MNPVRSLVAVIAGIVLMRVMTQTLEQTLVLSLADAPPADMAAYLAVRNRPGVLVTTLAAHTFTGVMAGYLVAKIAGRWEVRHAAVAAGLLVALFAWAFATPGNVALPPMWMRVGLLVVTGPALLAGATIRADARAVASSSTGADTRPREPA